MNVFDINTWIAVLIFITENCKGEILVRSNVREINIQLLCRRHMPQNAITKINIMNHADFCMHLYDAIYNIPKCKWFNCVIIQHRQTIYTQYNTLECRGIPNEGPAQSKIVLVFSRAKTSCSPPSECAQIHPAFLIEIIELGKWQKVNIWKLNTSANDLPMKPLSKRSRTSCPHYCIGPVPGHFDHWIDGFVSFDQMHRLVVSESSL